MTQKTEGFGICDYCYVRIVEGGNRIESIKVWWKNMDFNETILDLNNGSTTSYVPWTGFLNILNFVVPPSPTHI